jgi:hypothetical protein
MTSDRRKQRLEDTEGRLHHAEAAAAEVEKQGDRVEKQLSLVDRLSAGWRRVHQANHLAELFRKEGHI